jgi:hypothetical protein
VTRTGSAKTADKSFGEGRLQLARAYLKAAQDETELADEDSIGNPVISQIVHAAIAYMDALTAKFAGHTNQQDHGGAVKMLRDALGTGCLALRRPACAAFWPRRTLPSMGPGSRPGRMPSGCSLRWSSLPHGQKANSAGPDDPAICSLMRRTRHRTARSPDFGAYLAQRHKPPRRERDPSLCRIAPFKLTREFSANSTVFVDSALDEDT